MSVQSVSLSVPALDLRAQYESIRDEIEPVLRAIVESQHFILGPEVSGFEVEAARYCRVSHAIGCASGSDALLLPLQAWGVGAGDEVITTPYSFFATAGAIWRLGAKPVFVDIEPGTYNIDPARIEEKISPRTRAIIPVHLYGQAAELAPIVELAAKHDLKVLEDAAQAIGAEYRGCRVGAIGDAAAFSFYPSKNLGAFGDAGMVTTNDDACARQISRLRVHGMEPKYHHHEVGINSRLDALQAAVLRVKLRRLEEWTQSRRLVAKRYVELLRDQKLDDAVLIPVEKPGNFHVFNQFVIRVAEHARDPLRAHLAAKRIGTEVYYPIPLHLQTCFGALNHRSGDFPNSEAAAKETIAIPMYPELSDSALEYVVGSIAEFFRGPASN